MALNRRRAPVEKTETLKTKPKVIQGEYSTRTEHPDGRTEFVIDWDALSNHVSSALKDTPKKITRKKKSA